MNACKTCMWWGRGQTMPYSDDLEEGEVMSEAKRCGLPIVNIEYDGFCAVKGKGIGLSYPVCDLVTGPYFGCIHHDEKEKWAE